jgi:hypothetical protein
MELHCVLNTLTVHLSYDVCLCRVQVALLSKYHIDAAASVWKNKNSSQLFCVLRQMGPRLVNGAFGIVAGV